MNKKKLFGVYVESETLIEILNIVLKAFQESMILNIDELYLMNLD